MLYGNSKTLPGVYENSKSITLGYLRAIRASPWEYKNSKSIAGGI